MPTNTRTTSDRPHHPLYASIGVGDFAVAKLRDLSGELQKLPTELQKLPAELQKMPAAVSGQVKVLREQAVALSDRAGDLYADFTVRGEKLVGAVRRQPATRAAARDVKNVKRQAKGASTSAQKAAKATAAAAEQTADKIG